MCFGNTDHLFGLAERFYVVAIKIAFERRILNPQRKSSIHDGTNEESEDSGLKPAT